MFKKILLFTRRTVTQAEPTMFILGVLFVVLYGISILAGRGPAIDVSDMPRWLGNLFLYGGFFLMLCYLVDICYQLIEPLISVIKKGAKKKTTLLEKIRRVELGE